MRLKLTLNIGKADATRLGLKATTAGDVVDVGAEATDELLKRGWGVAAADEPARTQPAPSPANTAGNKPTGGMAGPPK